MADSPQPHRPPTPAPHGVPDRSLGSRSAGKASSGNRTGGNNSIGKRNGGKGPTGQGKPPRNGKAEKGGKRKRAGGLRLREARSGQGWELVHPRGVQLRTDDMQVVHQMLEAGETEIAQDEVRWLLSGCNEFIEAHCVLGELALLDQDLPLARGHFGYAFELGAKAIRSQGSPTPIPYALPTNQHLFEAGKGLAWCLVQLAKPRTAVKVIDELLAWDPTDPLGVRGLLPAS